MPWLKVDPTTLVRAEGSTDVSPALLSVAVDGGAVVLRLTKGQYGVPADMAGVIAYLAAQGQSVIEE